MANDTTWENAVRWYRDQRDSRDAITQNYFDLPVLAAAQRFEKSEEFEEVARLLGSGDGRRCLDVGAGNGIASYAFALRGWRVTALEPDPSEEVGNGAIGKLNVGLDNKIQILNEWGERIPAGDETFDAVYVRQVLHHALDLRQMLREISRVLVKGGLMLATREHVADDEVQLAAFLKSHPLHHLYGGECAYPLEEYLSAIRAAGLQLMDTWGPLSSILNFYPGSEEGRRKAAKRQSGSAAFGLGRMFAWSQRFVEHRARIADQRDRTPGRIFSFLARKGGETAA